MLDTFVISPSRRRIAEFDLLRPNTVKGVCGLLGEKGAVLHAGGIDLVNLMKAGLQPKKLITLSGVSEMREIRVDRTNLLIGPSCTHWQIENDPLLKALMPEVARYVSGLGNVRIRAQGTIGGNIMAGMHVYEMLPLLMALDAEFDFVDTRQMLHTVRARTASPLLIAQHRAHLLASIKIPLQRKRVTWDRSLRPVVGLVASSTWNGNTVVSAGAVVNGDGVPPSWREVPLEGMGRVLVRAQTAELVTRWSNSLPAMEPASGASGEYCHRVAGVMAQRALLRMTEEAHV